MILGAVSRMRLQRRSADAWLPESSLPNGILKLSLGCLDAASSGRADL